MTLKPARSSRFKIGGFFVRVAIGLGLLGLAIQMNRDEIQGVLDRKPDLLGFVVGLAYYLGGLMFAYLRWYMLVRALGLPFRYIDAVRLGLIGALFNFVIPGAVVGNAVRAGFLCKERPDQKPVAILSVLIDFLSGLTALFLIAALVGSFGYAELDPRIRKLVPLAWGLVAVAMLAMVSAIRPRRLRKRTANPSKSFGGRMAMVPVAVVMGLGTHAMTVMAFHSVSVALFGADVPGLAAHFLIVPIVLFTTAVPLPFGALGISEQASAGLFGMMGYPGGAVAMLGFRILQFAGAGIGAGVYMLNIREVRRLSDLPQDDDQPPGQPDSPSFVEEET